MKSLILALIFFAVLVYGCYDVAPFKPMRRKARQTSAGQPATGPLPRQTGPLRRPGRQA